MEADIGFHTNLTEDLEVKDRQVKKTYVEKVHKTNTFL